MVAADEHPAGLSAVVEEFTDEIGGPPTLGELLEIIVLSVPSVGPAVAEIPRPLELRAKVTPNRWYRSRSRAGWRS
jgi:hypothetical protein